MSSSSLMAASESTASTRARAGGAMVRKARLQDAVNIFELVNSLSGDGTLLRRSYADICENVRDFAVAESESGIFLGCGALHLYGPHLAEVRSIVVKPEAKGQGAGGRILLALLEEAGQDIQGLPGLSAAVRVRRGGDGARPAAPDCSAWADADRAAGAGEAAGGPHRSSY